jgi:hypothetical protein
MSSPIKLCIHCTHYSAPDHKGLSAEQYSRCEAAGTVNMVTGIKIPGFCDQQRGALGSCGSAAKLWIAKIEVTHE